MGRTRNGVEIRPASIRVVFSYQGRQHKETLRTDGKPMSPTPANVRYAHRLASEIRDRIRFGTFVFAEYFPDSPRATTGVGLTVGDQLDLWLRLQLGRASSTLKGYRIAKEWWKRHIGHHHLRALRHSHILAALATEPTWSGKTRNNKVSVLRQALDLAIRDGLLQSSPLDGLEAAVHQRPVPDPFDLAEVELILSDMRERYDQAVVNYFEFKFFTGLRTSESLAIRWDSVDFRRREMVVSEAIVLGEHKDNTKTNDARTVQLNSRAMAALQAQKAHTFMDRSAGGWVFLDPKTRQRWVDDWTPREMYWRPALKRQGIRYRSPYETRHTYATMMLMAGVTPAYAARQLGHTVEMFLRTYSRWIDGGHNSLEMGKLEGLLGINPGIKVQNKA